MARGVGRSVENLESEARPPPRLFEGAPKIVKETTAPPEEADTPTSTTAPPQVADAPTEVTEAPPVEEPPSGLPEGMEMTSLDDASLEELADFL